MQSLSGIDFKIVLYPSTGGTELTAMVSNLIDLQDVQQM